MDQQETIKLPIAVLSGLYNNCLVDLKNPDPTSKVPASESTETLAGLSVDTVVVSLAEGKELPSQQLEFLNNIMKGISIPHI